MDGHSAIENGWFRPSLKTVEQVEKKARMMLADNATDTDPALRIMGRIEGMAIALAILKGTSARTQLDRIMKGADNGS